MATICAWERSEMKLSSYIQGLVAQLAVKMAFLPSKRSLQPTTLLDWIETHSRSTSSSLRTGLTMIPTRCKSITICHLTNSNSILLTIKRPCHLLKIWLTHMHRRRIWSKITTMLHYPLSSLARHRTLSNQDSWIMVDLQPLSSICSV